LIKTNNKTRKHTHTHRNKQTNKQGKQNKWTKTNIQLVHSINTVKYSGNDE